jgi:hypothetical protein
MAVTNLWAVVRQAFVWCNICRFFVYLMSLDVRFDFIMKAELLELQIYVLYSVVLYFLQCNAIPSEVCCAWLHVHMQGK